MDDAVLIGGQHECNNALFLYVSFAVRIQHTNPLRRTRTLFEQELADLHATFEILPGGAELGCLACTASPAT